MIFHELIIKIILSAKYFLCPSIRKTDINAILGHGQLRPLLGGNFPHSFWFRDCLKVIKKNENSGLLLYIISGNQHDIIFENIT